MTIIITRNGKEAQKLEKDNFANEGEVQKYIHENPESLPLYEVKNDIQLFILLTYKPITFHLPHKYVKM